MSLLSDFKARFPAPEFADAVVDVQVPILESVWPCYYGGGYSACNKEIVLNLIAHLIWMDSQPGQSSIREQKSRSVGSVSVTNGSATVTGNLHDFFGMSRYGQRFLLLTSARGQRAYFV